MTRSPSRDNRHVKKIRVDQLRPGMYVHDINCGWMDHPFVSGHFLVRDDKTVATVNELGIRELYIDTDKGTDIADAPLQADVQQDIREQLNAIAEEKIALEAVPLEQEVERAQILHKEANKVVRSMLADIRLGKQIEIEQIDPLVEDMIDSIFRNQDALLPLSRLKTHDEYTFQHSVSVCTLMIAFARGLKLERQVIKEIAIGALLHDVGKAKVPDHILNKPAKLTDTEFDKMKSHVVQSKIILQHTPGITQIALDVAAQHHERFDGTGYPNKLKGDEISLYGQMAAIVDVYDALTSVRVYKKGMPSTEALGKLLEWSKFHFDPEMVRRYIKSVGIYPTGSLVRLESGRLGVVTEQHADMMLQPVVKVFFHAEKALYLPPEVVDLAKPGCADKVVGHESFEAWNIDPRKWLPG